MKPGIVIAGMTPETRRIFGRILEVVYFPEGWYNDNDERPIYEVVVEDFPTIGSGLQFVTASQIRDCVEVPGLGLPAPRWTKIQGVWTRDDGVVLPTPRDPRK